jgi:nicotinate-nucleotide adenylyltransferase
MAPAIGVMGGTFDPVHFGHLRPAMDVAQALNLAQVRLVPAAIPPHRQSPVAEPKVRRLMLELAIKGLEGFVVDERELEREGPSYTLDTLISLRADFKDNPLYLLLGTDAFQGLTTWSRWEQLLDYAHIVVMQRAGEPMTLADDLAAWYQQHLAKPEDAETLAGKIWPVEVTQLEISATHIRFLLAQGKNPRFLMPDSVIELIRQLGLYPQQ